MYRELLGAYALAAVSREEMAAVESHLDECASCRSEVSELRAIVAVVPLTVEDRAPSPGLRSSILAAVAAEQAAHPRPSSSPQQAAPIVDLAAERRWRSLLPWAAVAAMLLLSVGLLAWNFSLRDEAESPEPQTIAFEPAAADVDAGAEAMWMEEAGVIKVWLTDMPESSSDEVYQVWMIGESGPVSAGIMTEASAPIAIAANPADFDMLAITMEPGPMGMPSPTSDPILTGQF